MELTSEGRSELSATTVWLGLPRLVSPPRSRRRRPPLDQLHDPLDVEKRLCQPGRHRRRHPRRCVDPVPVWRSGAFLEYRENRAGRTTPPSPTASPNVAACNTPSSARRENTPCQTAGRARCRPPADSPRRTCLGPRRTPPPLRRHRQALLPDVDTEAPRETTTLLGHCDPGVIYDPGGKPRDRNTPKIETRRISDLQTLGSHDL